METQKLSQILKIVNSVTVISWNTVLHLVEGIQEGYIEVKSKKWADSWKQNNPEWYDLNLANTSTWSTFERCIDLHFSYEEQLTCHVKLYEGDSIYGHRKQLRFEAVLILPDSFLVNIERELNWKFERYLDSAYEKHLEAQKRQWIDKKRNKLLNLS